MKQRLALVSSCVLAWTGLFPALAGDAPVPEDPDMRLLETDFYRYCDPLFEGARVLLGQMGHDGSPEYVLGLSGSVFKVAGGCPSRPTCVHDFWPADFFRRLGYEVQEYPCADGDGNDVSGRMIEAVKASIDRGRPALVWHAFSYEEWDVVCGYDGAAGQFIGRSAQSGPVGYAREPWDRPKNSNVWGFGAVVVGDRRPGFDSRDAEIQSLERAVAHANKTIDGDNFAEMEGIQAYQKWASLYAAPGAERGAADSYCHQVYSSVRKAAVAYLRGLADQYGGEAAPHLRDAADRFGEEAEELDRARPLVGWDSPWGVDEERSGRLAPILARAADAYRRGMESLGRALPHLR